MRGGSGRNVSGHTNNHERQIIFIIRRQWLRLLLHDLRHLGRMGTLVRSADTMGQIQHRHLPAANPASPMTTILAYIILAYIILAAFLTVLSQWVDRHTRALGGKALLTETLFESALFGILAAASVWAVRVIFC